MHINPDARPWIVAGPASALARLRPLISVHQSRRPVLVFESLREITPYLNLNDADLNDAAAVLCVGDAQCSPGTALPGVFLATGNRRRIPTGWLPDAGEPLEIYAHAAAEAQLRCNSSSRRGPVVLLGQNEQRALELTARIAGDLKDVMPVFQWTEERITRQDLVNALRVGPGAAIYCGHGLANGWMGYGGFDGHDALAACGHPIGAVLSLSCSIASRPASSCVRSSCVHSSHHQSSLRRSSSTQALSLQGDLSFAENLVLTGLCCAALGAAEQTLHHRNVELALAFARALRSESVTTLADLVGAEGVREWDLDGYRIIGDPLAPLIGHVDATEKALAVFAPGPDEPLPVAPLSSWAS
jgi:hypothetical protein